MTGEVARAQVPVAPATASADEVFRWLRGGDQRLVAWGASFAVKNGEQDMAPELARLADNWLTLPTQEYDARGNYVPRTPEQRERLDAMEAVLDALIQMHGTLSSAGVKALWPDFPAQAMTLFAWMPEAEKMRVAAEMYATRRMPGAPREKFPWPHEQMVHMAAALMAERPPAGYAASLIDEANIRLKVDVLDEVKTVGLGGGTSTCGDSFGVAPAPGWPAHWTYVVEERWGGKPRQGETLLVAGDPAITTRRAGTNSSCSTLSGFGTPVRLQLAKQMAGLPKVTPGLGVALQANLLYPGQRGYDEAVAALLREYLEPFHGLAAALAGEGWMTPQEAAVAAPTLYVWVQDKREDRTPSLPVPRVTGVKVVFEEKAEMDALGRLVGPD